MNMSKYLQPLFVLVAVLLCSSDATARAKDAPSIYGRVMLAEFVVSNDVIEKFNAFKPSAPKPEETGLVNYLLADTETWVGPRQDLETSKNPYTLVVIVTGKAVRDGDVITSWHSGWKLEDGVAKFQPFAGVMQTGVKAGQRVVITKAAPANRTDENKPAHPVLSLVRSENFEFESMKVQLWSGIGEATTMEKGVAFYGMWVGLGMLVALWWFRRRGY
jgi:hypothetical protein